MSRPENETDNIMIVGNISLLETAILPAKLLSVLREHAASVPMIAARKDGRYELEGKDIFVMLSTVATQPVSQRRTEFHHDYLDIQLVLEGQEWIGIGPFNWVAPDIAAEKPDAYYTSDLAAASHLRLAPGDFAIFYPGEPHQALCTLEQPGTVRKAVFKIHKDCLN